MDTIMLDGIGYVSAARVIAIGKAGSAPLRRLLAALPPEKVVVLTGGRRRQSVMLLDTGHAVVTALPVGELRAQLEKAGAAPGEVI